MKKYLFGAMALPLLFACSSEDFNEQVVSNDQFAGIQKVDATFTMDEPTTRFDGGVWTPEQDDVWGFAWMGGGEATAVTVNGNAWQNHNLIQTGSQFVPQTAIYVGNYYIYRPYDKTTVNVGKINFKSLEEQPLAEGYASTTQAWKDLAKTAINIGDKWTVVTAAGHTNPGTGTKIWDKAGIKQNYDLYAAMFSNQTGLDLKYEKNNPTFAAATPISGATDIDHTFAAGDGVGAADIYEVTVDLDGAAKSFTYAPTASPNGTSHSGSFWANKSGASGKGVEAADGFTFTDDVITLTNEAGVSTGANGSKGWFWFNSLPVTAGNATTATAVQTVLTTSYGVVTVNSTVGACAYEFDKYNGSATSKEWIKLDATDNATTSPKKWNLAGSHNTFVNQYGNHKGKYALTVDFSTGVMNNMHIKSDAHLQKLLKYYIASGKTDAATLLLDKDADNEFKLSKISIALIQTIQDAGHNVKIKACTDGAHTPGKIVITQEGQAALNLASATEVPELDDVFAAATNVYLAKNTTWTWKDRTGANQLTTDANVSKIINMGTLTVNAKNIELTNGTLENAAGATMNITEVTTVKTNLTNDGTINVGSASNTAAELRAYNATVTNNATALNASGTINNYGVVGKSAGTSGKVDNYGLIDMKDAGAITLLRTNEKGATPFGTAFAAGTNMMGTVILPNSNPYALVSVSNGDETGFIKYTWTAGTYSHDAGNVKYNTLVIQRPDNDKIQFTGACDEVKYLEFDGIRTQVVNPTASDKLTELKGVIVNAGKSIIIEKTNQLVCSDGAYLGAGASVYLGGVFTYVGINNYFGTWSLDQIVEW